MSDVPAFHLGLIGYPLGHSLSPVIHQTALEALGLEGSYRLYPVPPLPAGEAALAEHLMATRNGALAGLNVTIPHKQTVLPRLDALTPTAQAIGAVNTILCREHRLLGDNTDAFGFYRDLMACWRRARRDLPQGRAPRAAVLGSGGSARAVTYALRSRGWQVVLFARRPHQTADWPHPPLEALPWEARHDLTDAPCDLLVNCTPLGMLPHTEGCPWPADTPLPAEALVYDLVYNPEETVLVRRARRQGLPAFTGLGMLVEQAALAFERWTGLAAPREVMLAAARRALRTPTPMPYAASLPDRR